ncbi:hypothetical protein [Desulfocicer niacini]
MPVGARRAITILGIKALAQQIVTISLYGCITPYHHPYRGPVFAINIITRISVIIIHLLDAHMPPPSPRKHISVSEEEVSKNKMNS